MAHHAGLLHEAFSLLICRFFVLWSISCLNVDSKQLMKAPLPLLSPVFLSRPSRLSPKSRPSKKRARTEPSASDSHPRNARSPASCLGPCAMLGDYDFARSPSTSTSQPRKASSRQDSMAGGFKGPPRICCQAVLSHFLAKET
eukprot:TRINITY_DN70202_c0_g2_i1.p1 TRINITY_DN70202_c0_g2~~TRINITY_DN70202_c0_g2_i1.p1  ORF type:complete len:143 (-),score=9.90 TRINITY_DN70202_c0_g2_i1:137-565(-)